MAKNRQIRNDSFVLFSLDKLLPHDHLVRNLEEFIDWDFIYEVCDPLYSDLGTNRIDPVVLFKLMMINIIFGIHSMRKACAETQVNIAYHIVDTFLTATMSLSVLIVFNAKNAFPLQLKYFLN